MQCGGQGCGQLGPQVWVTCAFLTGVLGFTPLAKAVVLSASSPMKARFIIYFIIYEFKLEQSVLIPLTKGRSRAASTVAGHSQQVDDPASLYIPHYPANV